MHKQINQIVPKFVNVAQPNRKSKQAERMASR